MLETSESIEIKNKDRIYTDCMEYSLLRFLQLCTYDSEQILKDKFSFYPDEIIYNDLINKYINNYPIIYPDADFYDLSENGKEQRNSWSEFISDRDFLDYYRNDYAELFTSVENIIKFFNGFFQMNLDTNEDNHQKSLNLISEKFSNNKKKISIKITKIEKHKMYMEIRQIIKYLSRPDTEYKNKIDSDELYEVITSITHIDIKIDGFDYQWILEQIYLSEPTSFSNKFITGHSVIYSFYE